MRKALISLPDHLQNGSPRPKFTEIRKGLPTVPRYKIVVISTDRLEQYRVVHGFYIAVISTDPSQIRKAMEARGLTAGQSWEDGQPVADLITYSERLRLSEMPQFSSSVADIVQNHSAHYAMTPWHGLVQYSPDPFREPIVYTTISRR